MMLRVSLCMVPADGVLGMIDLDLTDGLTDETLLPRTGIVQH